MVSSVEVVTCKYIRHSLLSVAGMFRKRDLRGGRERYMRGGYNRRLQNWPVEQQLSDVSSTNDICAINHLWYLILD